MRVAQSAKSLVIGSSSGPHVFHPRFSEVEGDAGSFAAGDQDIDLVELGFGIHELHSDEERKQLVNEIHRVLAPNGKIVLFERGWSPWLAFVFSPLFLYFTPAKEWEVWLRKHFTEVSALSWVSIQLSTRPARKPETLAAFL